MHCRRNLQNCGRCRSPTNTTEHTVSLASLRELQHTATVAKEISDALAYTRVCERH